MAIQHRRGNYEDLDISKLVQGEPFVTLDYAPDGHYYVGIAIGPNNVVRLAAWDDLTDVLNDCRQAASDAHDSETNAATSEQNAADSESNAEAWAVGERGGVPVTSEDDTYENNSKYYSERSGYYWDCVHDAVDLVIPTVTINFTTGELEYTGSQLMFYIDQTTGNLMWNVTTGS